MNDAERLRDLAFQLWVADGRQPVPRDQLIMRANAILVRSAREHAGAGVSEKVTAFVPKG